MPTTRRKKHSAWIDFAVIRREVSMEQVLEHYALLDSLEEKDDGYKGLCPFHEGESEYPFHVSTSKNLWHCFGCDDGGNVLDFVSQTEDVSIKRAAELLAEWFDVAGATSRPKRRKARQRPESAPQETPAAGNKCENGPVSDDLEPPKGLDRASETESQKLNKPLDFTLKNLDPRHKDLKHLGFKPETIEHFEAGYCSRGLMAGRLAIPIHTPAGDLLAYAGLALDREGPGWKFPGNFLWNLELYNLHRATEGEQNDENGLIVVADIIEVWELYETGRENAVALMGFGVSSQQLETLGPAVGASGKVTIAQSVERTTDLANHLLEAGLWVTWQDFSFAHRRKAE